MSDVISDYQKWKQEGESLRVQAKHAMEMRFRELLAEAAQIAQDYHTDFGMALKPAPPVTTFRFRTAGKGKGNKPAAKSATPAKGIAPVKGAAPGKAAEARPVDPKVARLNKRLEAARKKLDEAKAAGAPTRVIEDKVYEIEDELRLSVQKG
jgi:hypothetical protein